MRWLSWPQLPLLIIVQLLEPSSRSNQKMYVEALLAFKSALSHPEQVRNWVGRRSCFRSRTGASWFGNPNAANSYSLLSGTLPQCPKSELTASSPCASSSPPSQHLSPVHAFFQSRKTRIITSAGGNVGLPTLMPSQNVNANRPRKPNIAVIIGACLGAAFLVVVIILLVYVCLMRFKRFIRRTSETGSSTPTRGEFHTGNGSPHTASRVETGNFRQLTIVELKLASSNFSQSNVVGEGGFGFVYKGLLQDGSIVAIKRRLHEPSQIFLAEVENIACISHKHLVKLIGCCQENDQQLLVYEYLPYGNVGNHLYDAEGLPIGKLGMRQRLSIAVSAAKGLEYLHCLRPPFLHMHFRTSNVLVDENYAIKVSDFGLSRLMVNANRAGSSSGVDCFVDPELSLSNEFSTRNDVYSFGVFLLELISGREALGRNQSDPTHNLVAQAKGITSFENFLDEALRKKPKTSFMKWMMGLALLCVDTGVRRPTMTMVVRELELIQEREIGRRTTDQGEEIGDVTLGSELFQTFQ